MWATRRWCCGASALLLAMLASAHAADVEAPAPPTSIVPPLPVERDRSTPQRTWSGFLAAVTARDYAGAARYLDLTDVAAEQRDLVGPDRALKLLAVFRALNRRAEVLPDEPDPRPYESQPAGSWSVLAADHAASGTHVEITLSRTPGEGGPVWLVARSTVASVSAWHAAIVEGARHEDHVLLNQGLGPPPADLDLSTPARSVQNFVGSCRAGDFERAARSLWLDDYPVESQRAVGARLSRRLVHVLDQQLWIDFAQVSDSPYGRPESANVPEDEDEVGTIPLDGRAVSIRSLRVPVGEGAFVWVLAPQTVARIDALYAAYGVGPLIDWVPGRFFGWRVLEVELWQWAGVGTGLALALVVSTLLVRVVRPIVRALQRRTRAVWADRVLASSRGAVHALLFLALTGAWLRRLGLAVPAARVMETLLHVLWVPAVAWFVVRLIATGVAALESRLAGSSAQAFTARALSTRLAALQRIAGALVWVVAVALVLERFEVVKHVGTGLLASAGVAGLAVGLAAQQTLRNFLAGIQLAVTEPIRIGDVLVFEGEWGVVEEISFSNVVIRIWDLRRLVVPVTYLLERPIENWTRSSPELLGTVFVHVDYRTDVTAARAHAIDVVRRSSWWNRKVEPQLLVTDLREDTIQLRVMVSADDGSSLWNLRCEVREAMLGWLQDHAAHPRRRFAGTLERTEPPEALAGPDPSGAVRTS